MMIHGQWREPEAPACFALQPGFPLPHRAGTLIEKSKLLSVWIVSWDQRREVDFDLTTGKARGTKPRE